MNDKDFYTFVCDQYKAAFELSNAMYTRAGVILTAQVVLGGAAISLGRYDLVRRLFDRVDIFDYHMFALGAIVCVGLAIAQLIRTVLPRDYPKVVDMAAWRKWREDYSADLKRTNPADQQANAETHASACLNGMLDRLIPATDNANQLNQERLLCLQRSIRLTAFGVAALAGQAVLAFILKVQGA